MTKKVNKYEVNTIDSHSQSGSTTGKPLKRSNITVKGCVEDSNFVEINLLTRQYFLLMMNILESPFLMRFFSHQHYKGNDKKKAEKPEKLWEVKTTPYTRAFLTDGAIVYKATWDTELLETLFSTRCCEKLHENQFLLKTIEEIVLKRIGCTKNGKQLEILQKAIVASMKRLRQQEVYFREDNIFGSINKDIFNKDWDIRNNNQEISIGVLIARFLENCKKNEMYFVVPHEIPSLNDKCKDKCKDESKDKSEDKGKDKRKDKRYVAQLANLDYEERIKKLRNGDFTDVGNSDLLSQVFELVMKTDTMQTLRNAIVQHYNYNLFFKENNMKETFPDWDKDGEDYNKIDGKYRYKTIKEKDYLSAIVNNYWEACKDGKSKQVIDYLIQQFKKEKQFRKYFFEQFGEKFFKNASKKLVESDKDNLIEFDVVAFFGDVLYDLSVLFKSLVEKNNKENQNNHLNFDFSARRKMNGCSWVIPPGVAIQLDPNLLWPKLDIDFKYDEDSHLLQARNKEKYRKEKYSGSLINIANGVKWKSKELTLSHSDEFEIEIKRQKIAFMSSDSHQLGQTKATLKIKDFVNDPNKIDINYTATFPYICGSFDLLTEVQFGKEGDENKLLLFTT